jgi:hypothetical protein
VDGGYTIQEYWEMHAKLTAQILDERAMFTDKALQLAEKKEELARKAMWGYLVGGVGIATSIITVFVALTR